MVGRSFGGRNSILAHEFWNSEDTNCVPFGVKIPGGSDDGKKCRKTFDDATRHDVPEKESKQEPTKFIHHCEKVFVFASSFCFKANNDNW